MGNFYEIIQNLLSTSTINIAIVLITSFAISFFSIPMILNFTRSKNIFDKPNGRTSHYENTPTLGGVAIFAGITISLLLFCNATSFNGLQYIVASLMLVFFIGLKDDIYTISLTKKLGGQLLVIFILIFLGDFRFTNLGGFLGIYEISYITSVAISAFVFIVLINCINLIDGVDGLASGLSILIAFIFAIFFYSHKNTAFTLVSTSLLGALIPFFIYNVFGKRNKLFMGDTGALIIGVISVVLVVEFNEISASNTSGLIAITAAPAMSIALFFIPLYDTLQVFTLRLFKRKSPFCPDKNHLHHRLLRLGLSHVQTSIMLIAINLFVFVLSYFLQFFGVLALSFLILVIGLAISSILYFLLLQKQKQA
ncbi:MAG: undecaprenyl/decaprenyl-phosphate alpha-N-acetylglucosaminyl 1-phosphate transferase [Bacteroidales bacterium]|nr:undecaprenyl/decaprenyl-phosphate alpha-N-acetylglucosaminyl 1-phosphate transferase [Bacteroidales bacterium]